MATRMKTKAAHRRETADKRPRAIAKNLRISSRKASATLNLIRGKRVEEAISILAFTPKSGARFAEKVLKSAIANAENNLEMDRSELFVAEAYSGQGPTMKRWRPHSRGMARPYAHRTSHITVVLDSRN